MKRDAKSRPLDEKPVAVSSKRNAYVVSKLTLLNLCALSFCCCCLILLSGVRVQRGGCLRSVRVGNDPNGHRLQGFLEAMHRRQQGTYASYVFDILTYILNNLSVNITVSVQIWIPKSSLLFRTRWYHRYQDKNTKYRYTYTMLFFHEGFYHGSIDYY